MMGSEGTLLDSVREALRQSQYEEAVREASLISIAGLDKDELGNLIDLMLAAAAGLADNSETELEAYDLIIEFGDSLSREDVVVEAAVQLKTNSALFNKGVVLAQRGLWEEAIAVYDELVKRAAASRELGFRENAVRALFNKGVGLLGLHRPAEAIVVYDELINRFASDPEPILSLAVSKALVNKGIALAELRRFDEAIAVLDEVAARWSSSGDPLLRERASKALLNKASALVQLDHRLQALATYEQILQRFGADPDPALRQHTELARSGKTMVEASLN